MNEPTVSVVMAVCNGEAFIRDALASVQGQTVTPLEVIVVDDGSTDRTPEYVEREPGMTLLRQRNAGASAARNAAIARASGEWVAFLDSDDVWLPDKLERQLDLVGNRPELEIVGGGHLAFLEPGTSRPGWLNPRHLIDGTPTFVSSALLVKRSIFARLGMFDESLRFAEDFEWVARARAAGVPIGCVAEIVLRKRVHQTNTTHQLQGAQRTVTQTLMGIVRQRRAGAVGA